MLDECLVQEIKRIVTTCLDLSKNRAFIFGSRATGMNNQFSDVDLGLDGPDVTPQLVEKLKWTFEESDLPYHVDVVNFAMLDDQFRLVAEAKIVNLK